MALSTRASTAPSRSFSTSVAPLALLLALLLTAACDVNPYDASQRPRVSVSVAASVTMRWQPEGAQTLRVYRGATAGDGYGPDLMWSLQETSENSILSGVTYGSVPVGATGGRVQALTPGQTYTVQITRADPKGSGDGFTNTRNSYVGTASFVAP